MKLPLVASWPMLMLLACGGENRPCHVLATVGSVAMTPIDVDLVVADATLGGRVMMTRDESFRDVLSAGSLRQQAGLGDADVRRGRREIVRRVQRGEIASGGASWRTDVPSDVTVTTCGQEQLRRPQTR